MQISTRAAIAAYGFSRKVGPERRLPRDAPTTDQRIAWADEVFARLLLSGSDGVSMAALAEGPTFPRLADLGLPDQRLPSILDTRLFRPAAGTDRHEPVHRIVAEHCAARALVQRIDDPANTFTVKQCLSIVAPNGATRDDLRGLLGWMAALGSQNAQDAAIDVDPYAVWTCHVFVPLRVLV